MNHPICISLPTPFAIGTVNAYLFGERDRNGAILRNSSLTLVDCGVDSDESWRTLVAALAEHGLGVADIDHVLVTHAHVDHMGMAARVVANSQADVLVWERIAAWAHDTQHMWQERLRFLSSVLSTIEMADLQRESILNSMGHTLNFWPAVPKGRVKTFSLSEQVPLGGVGWDVLYMPGHSTTQTCFYQPDTGQFVAADMLLPLTPAPVLEQPLDGGLEREPCLPRLLESYERVHAMGIKQVYPGHGESFDNHKALIEQQQARIELRKVQCLELIRVGNHQFGQILDIMYQHHPVTERFTAVCTLFGYLDLLLADGTIRADVAEGKTRYYLVA